jgi:hypothetical protein
VPTSEACWFCIVGLHDECIAMTFNAEREIQLQCCCYEHKGDDAEAYVKGLPGRPLSDPEDITDILSTGRKRAEQAAPILNGMECEWARLRFAGGGVQPIMGCRGNLIWNARANKDIPTGHYRGERHHGPDKNVLNNTPGVNLHRVCSICHKRWHAANDEFYQGERPTADVPWTPVAPEDRTVQRHDPITEWEPEEYAAWLLDNKYAA